MARITWNEIEEGRYTSGVSHGVFYDEDGVGHAWDGLISVTEKPQNVEPTRIYNSLGQKYDLHAITSEKRHSVICYTFPDAMTSYLGLEYVDEVGAYADERPFKKFHMAYRNDRDGYYEVHVLLNQLGSLGEISHTSDSDTPGIANLSLNLEGVPHETYGSSHLVFDSRNAITKSAENLLFGDQNRDANFNDFLISSLDWIPASVNYVPQLQPDYDNYVWLGGENIAFNQVSTPYNETYYMAMFYDETNDVGLDVVNITPISKTQKPVILAYDYANRGNEYITTTIYYEKLDNEFDPEVVIVQSDGSKKIPVYSLVDEEANDGIRRMVVTHGPFTFEDGLSAQYNIEFYPVGSQSVIEDVNLRTDLGLRLHSFKSEVGTYSSPWTPGTNNRNYVPPVPPAHYVPGVKGSSKWNKVGVIPYWDEVNDMVGLYSTRVNTVRDGYVAIPVPLTPPTTIHAHGLFELRDPVLNLEGVPGVYGLSVAEPYSEVAALGESNRAWKLRVIDTADTNPMVVIDHGGLIGSSDLLFEKLMVTDKTTEEDYFDETFEPESNSERYRLLIDESGREYAVREVLTMNTRNDVIVVPIDENLFDLYANDLQLQSNEDEFVFEGDEATLVSEEIYEIDDNND